MTLELTASDQIDSADLLVLACSSSADGPVVTGTGLTEAQAAGLSSAAAAIGATGRADEVLRLPGEPWGLPPVMLTGLSATDQGAEPLRRAAGAALRAAGRGLVAVALPTGDDPVLLEAVGLGALIGAYRYRRPGAATEGTSPGGPEGIRVITITPGDSAAALHRAAVIGESVHLVRRLVDTPPGHLRPAELAAEAVDAMVGLPVTVEVLDEVALAEAGFGGILAVGQGSASPPRLVRLAYAPDRAAGHLGLVGKGITFDSGGLSLKPPAGMVTMKTDMAGAAVVLAAIRAIAELDMPVRVTGYLAIAENMPSGTAQRPGDVITAYGGTTVEVLNTDAEGRLVMMDALVRCAEDSPDAMVDIATLTGAQIVALGTRIAGVMGNDDAWRDEVAAAADAAGELCWPMPIPEELRPSLDSPVADLANIGERNAGMMTAAAFLRHFVPETLPWAHLDIAGPAYVEKSAWAYNGKGATGYGVRTLVALAGRMTAQ